MDSGKRFKKQTTTYQARKRLSPSVLNLLSDKRGSLTTALIAIPMFSYVLVTMTELYLPSNLVKTRVISWAFLSGSNNTKERTLAQLAQLFLKLEQVDETCCSFADTGQCLDFAALANFHSALRIPVT